MKVSKAIKICLDYHRNHSKPNTIRSYEAILTKFGLIFGDKDLEEISSEDILTFLDKITDGTKQQTRRTRYSHLAAFFNFIINNIDERIQNPCANQLLKKLYKANTPVQWDSFEKETIDEIIFRTTKLRNRLILELMARGGMRIGEVLKLTPDDISGQKLLIKDPKSGREQEIIFIIQKIADRLRDYINLKQIEFNQRIFPISYEAARSMVKKAGEMVGVRLRPHDLRRHAATYASRSGVPIEIISKIILRHANLSTIQMYLGKVSENEAMRWIENLYA
ncbi:MAG: site-specific integrase [Desulfobacterales bacterium]|jgi:integrase